MAKTMDPVIRYFGRVEASLSRDAWDRAVATGTVCVWVVEVDVDVRVDVDVGWREGLREGRGGEGIVEV